MNLEKYKNFSAELEKLAKEYTSYGFDDYQVANIMLPYYDELRIMWSDLTEEEKNKFKEYIAH